MMRAHRLTSFGLTAVACIGILGLLAALTPGSVQSQGATITPNYKDADIQQIIEAVGEVTGKNFILDPRVKAKVTMLSSTPMTADAFYEAFLSILQVYGFVAVPSGDVIKILPDSNARQLPGWEGRASGSRRADDIVTQVVLVNNVSAAQLVPILRPLIPQYGHLAAHPASNMLIISDRSANIDRILRIIRRIDQAGDDEFEVIRLEHASASETVRVVTSLQQSQRGDGGGSKSATTVVADDRTNSILISGDKQDRLRIRALITHLDTPLEDGGDARVRYLAYANAADLATKLETQFKGAAPAAGAAAPQTDISVWADEQTNALVVTAPPKVMRSMMMVIDKLDIRRAQVMVEAIVVEVRAGDAKDLGITWAAFNESTIAAATNFPNQTGGVVSLVGAATGDDIDVASVIGDGISLGIGRISDSGTSFAALIEALEAQANTNIMATPTLVTLDNEEAQIEVGEEVPFVTGSYTNTGAAAGSVNPFQTVEREQVGLTLKITPQINEGNAVLLKIDQEISSISESTQAVDLITNNRTISTSVIVEDRGTLVLGGLIRDEIRESEQRVPILGSIPWIGALFRARSTDLTKTNLMIFIKPTILRDSVSASYETNVKYNYIRNQQIAAREREFFDLGERPVLAEKINTAIANAPGLLPVLDSRAVVPSEAPASETQGNGDSSNSETDAN
jgi:general secretion pathway protein D